MACTDHGDALISRDAPVDHVRPKSVRMDDIRTMVSAQCADGFSLGEIVTVADMEPNYSDTVRLE